MTAPAALIQLLKCERDFDAVDGEGDGDSGMGINHGQGEPENNADPGPAQPLNLRT